MQKFLLGALAMLMLSATAQAQFSNQTYRRVEQRAIQKNMANMESISVRKLLDGLVQGNYVEQVFIDASNLSRNTASYVDVIVDDRVVKTFTITRQLARHSWQIQMRNGIDYTRILLRARGNVYAANIGVTIDDYQGGGQYDPPPVYEPPRPRPPSPRPPPPHRPRPPEEPPFQSGQFCNGSTVVRWECGRGASGAVYQGNGCYHTDTGRMCGGGNRPEPVRPTPPADPFTSGEFCNGSTVVRWECGRGASGTSNQGNGCYHTDTGRSCR